jgi:hypothetical protein
MLLREHLSRVAIRSLVLNDLSQAMLCNLNLYEIRPAALHKLRFPFSVTHASYLAYTHHTAEGIHFISLSTLKAVCVYHSQFEDDISFHRFTHVQTCIVMFGVLSTLGWGNMVSILHSCIYRHPGQFMSKLRLPLISKCTLTEYLTNRGNFKLCYVFDVRWVGALTVAYLDKSSIHSKPRLRPKVTRRRPKKQ